MANGIRKVITLNPKNPKEKAILEVLDKQYNYAEFIRNVLYEYIINNNILHHGNGVTIPLPHHDNTMTTPLPSCDNTMHMVLPHDDNTMHTSLQHDDNSKNEFLINISDLEDTDANITIPATEDPSQNALDFLKNSF